MLHDDTLFIAKNSGDYFLYLDKHSLFDHI